MADAVATTTKTKVKSIHPYELHILRRSYVTLLQRIDDAIHAERELEFASAGQPGGIFDPALSGYLRGAEEAWDNVTDCLSATIAAMSSVREDYPLTPIVSAWREILTSEAHDDFHRHIGVARDLIAKSCITADMSVIGKDAHQLLRATAGRLDALGDLNIYCDAPDPLRVSL